jgi:hypothetical protein
LFAGKKNADHHSAGQETRGDGDQDRALLCAAVSFEESLVFRIVMSHTVTLPGDFSPRYDLLLSNA